MGFGGTVLAMIQSLRANARPKHKAFQNWRKRDNQSFNFNKKLKFKTVSEDELKIIVAKNNAEIKKEQKLKNIKVFLSFIVLIPLSVFIVFYLFFKPALSNHQPYQPPHEETNNLEQVNYLLNSGYEWLNKNHYKNARFQFNRVLEINSKSKNAFYGLTASYIYECVLDSTSCEKAQKLLSEYNFRFGNDTSIEYLEELLINQEKQNELRKSRH